MFLILGHQEDPVSAGVRMRLAAQGRETLLLPSALAAPARLVWHLGPDGVESRLSLDGIRDADIEGVLVRTMPSVDAVGMEPADRAYMQAEMAAATLAWLTALPCPVVNRLSPALWYEPHPPLLLWRRALRRAGLAGADVLVTNDPAEALRFRTRLAAEGLAGAIYAPLTGGAWSVAGDAAWDGLARLQACAPVCLAAPHGGGHVACIVAGRVFWASDPTPEARDLAPALVALAADAGLAVIEVAVAPVRRGGAGGLGVVHLDPMPTLASFAGPAREGVVDAIAALLAPAAAEVPR